MYTIEELYRLYFHDIYLYLFALSRNKEVAEEITQETFFKAMKSLNRFRGDCDIRVWLCQIAKNSFYTYCTKNKHFEAVEVNEELSDDRVQIEKDYINKEQAQLVRRILDHMEESYREVFRLRVFAELPFRKIGEIFGRSENWARVTFHRARLKIMKEMEEKGYGE
ncbi:MAG: RNA polymerase sigma factor [Clostridium sp.]|nr:RNA polymerase sigma factor [Clostridium sp.]